MIHDGPLVDSVMNDSPLRPPPAAEVAQEPVESAPAPAAADPDPVVAPEPVSASESLLERVEHAVMDAIKAVGE